MSNFNDINKENSDAKLSYDVKNQFLNIKVTLYDLMSPYRTIQVS